jgi:hypothetical protein
MRESFKSSLVLSSWFLLLCTSAYAQPLNINDRLIDSQCKTARIIGNRAGTPMVIPIGSGVSQQPMPADMSQVGIAKGCTDDGKFCVGDSTYDRKNRRLDVVGILAPSRPGGTDRVMYREPTSLSCPAAEESALASIHDGTDQFKIGSQATDEHGKTVGVIARFSDGTFMILDKDSRKLGTKSPAQLHQIIAPQAVSESESKSQESQMAPDSGPPGSPTPDNDSLDQPMGTLGSHVAW